MGYWEERQAATQAALTKKSIEQVEDKVAMYYNKAQYNIIGQFRETYNRVLLSIAEGREPTPADLYKLDTYWKMQADVARELEKLGKVQAGILNRAFVMQYQQIYDSLAVQGEAHYTQLDTKAIESMINSIWCADGKSWSERIWENTERLHQSLNDNLLDCLLTGKNPDFLKGMLMDSFNVSYNRADMLVRTEMAHIQIKAAQDRYLDSGVEFVQVWADKDERQCKVCGNLHTNVYRVGEKLPIPAHPNCRCSILPVVDYYKSPIALIKSGK